MNTSTLKANTTRLVNALKEGKRLTPAKIRSKAIGVPNPSATIFHLRRRRGMGNIVNDGTAYFLKTKTTQRSATR